jgi:hypothetical protein
MRKLVPALVLFLALVAGCKSTEEKLYDLRGKSTEAIDALYKDFGASEAVNTIAKGAEQAAQSDQTNGVFADISRAIGGAVVEADREDFALQCLTQGRGGHPVLLTPKGRAFFARPETQKACRGYALLQDQITKLEAALAKSP